MSGTVHTGVKVCRIDSEMYRLVGLGFSLYATLSVCHMVATLDDREKSEMEVSAD